MLPRISLLVSFILVSLSSFAGNGKYAAVDSFVKRISMPVNDLSDYDSLISIIDGHFSKQEEKVRAVYFWVTENIAYDGEGLYKGNMIFEKTGALKEKKCVCAGYADLLDHAFKKMGLASEYLVGKARLLDGKFQWDPKSWLNGHAWNAVMIDDEWKLIDATWASGYLSGSAFYKQRDDLWFLTGPQIFILSHYPDKPQYQLLAVRLTLKEFYDQPYCLWDFAKTGIIDFWPRKLILNTTPGKPIRIIFRSAKEINRVTIKDEWGSILQLSRVEKEGDDHIFYIYTKSSAYGQLYLGFAYVDEKQRYVWKADHVLAYFLSFTTIQTANTD